MISHLYFISAQGLWFIMAIGCQFFSLMFALGVDSALPSHVQKTGVCIGVAFGIAALVLARLSGATS